MDEDLPEQTLFAKFEKRDQFMSLLHTILSLDLEVDPTEDGNRSEISLLRQLSEIVSQRTNIITLQLVDDEKVDEYQEQSYLLDPFLEQLVVPAVEKLKAHAKTLVINPSTPVSHARLDRVAQLLYNYIKFRGYKTISRFPSLFLFTYLLKNRQSDSFPMKLQTCLLCSTTCFYPPAPRKNKHNGLCDTSRSFGCL
jgi:hypothetical protein